jgi:hypothetical protein
MAASACMLLSGCATAELAPNARPLPESAQKTMGPTPMSLVGNQVGVGKTWYYTSTNGSGAGMIGVIASAIADAIINAAPSARAQRQAGEVADLVTVEKLNESLLAKLKAEAKAIPTGNAITVPTVALTQKFTNLQEASDDLLEVNVSYLLSEDSTVMQVTATVTYSNKALPYKTPYTFTKGVPASETKGPLYRNTFTYYSKPLPVPTLTPELKARLVESVKEAARTESGAMPDPKSQEYKALERQIELANDDKLSPTESSVFLTREWLRNKGSLLNQEISRSENFIAHYVFVDLKSTAIPSLTGTDELLETAADERTVRRIGKGVGAGSYVSSAANVTDFATYGNAVAIAKTTTAYVNKLKAAQPKVAR